MAAVAGGGFDEALHRRQLEARLHQPPPEGVRWTLSRVQACFDWLAGYSPGGVSRLLHAWHWGVRQAQVQHFSPDPEYAAKVEQLLHCLEQVAAAPQHVALLFLDERGYTAWPEPGLQWAPLAPAAPPMAYKHLATAMPSNNRQWRVVGALNAWNGQVDFLDDYKVGRKQLIRFYAQLVQRYQHYQRLVVVQDNWSVHRHEDVQHALSHWPQLEIVWLPTYAPWLNPIEKLWRWLRQDVLKLHRLADDFAALRQRVRAFFDRFAGGSQTLLHYVGLQGDGLLATALHHYLT
jgi:transposase